MPTISPLSVARAQSGDVEAMDRILAAVQDPLLRHIRAIVIDEDDAWDILQDVLVSVVRKLQTLRDPRWFRAWAYRIATRAAVRHASGRKFRDDVLYEDLPERPAPDISESAEVVVARAEAMIDALPPAAGTAVRMHFIDGLSYAEIAEALEVSIGTVKSRIAYGRALLTHDQEDSVSEQSGSSAPT